MDNGSDSNGSSDDDGSVHVSMDQVTDGGEDQTLNGGDDDDNEDGPKTVPKAPDRKKVVMIAALMFLLITGGVTGVLIWLFGKKPPEFSTIDANNMTNDTLPVTNSTDTAVPSAAPSTAPSSPSNPDNIPEVKGDWESYGTMHQKRVPGDQFGSFVCYSKGIHVFGAPGNNTVWVVKSDVEEEAQRDEVALIETGVPYYGSVGSLSGDASHLAVGAPSFPPSNGRVTIYTVSIDDSDSDKPKLDISFNETTTDGDKFGNAVSLSHSGHQVAIGAPHSKDGGRDSGKVFVYNYTGTEWVSYGKSVSGDEDDLAGSAVALSPDGSTLVIGYPGRNSGTGSVIVYKYNAGNRDWTTNATEVPIDGIATGDRLGVSIAYSLSDVGEFVAVGATGHSTDTMEKAGLCVVYDIANTIPVKRGSILVGSASGEQFGHAVALQGNSLAVTSETYDNNRGIVRVYQFDNDWSETGSITGAREDEYLGAAVLFSTIEDIEQSFPILLIAARGNTDTHGRVFSYKLKDQSETSR